MVQEDFFWFSCTFLIGENFMKKLIVLLFILFTCCVCFSQEAVYEIVSETEIINKNFEPAIYPRAVEFVSFEQLKEDFDSLKY